MKMYGPISTPYSDCAADKPSPGSAEGLTFGDPLPGSGPTKVGGILEEVQYSDIGPKAGTRQTGDKISGGGSQ